MNHQCSGNVSFNQGYYSDTNDGSQCVPCGSVSGFGATQCFDCSANGLSLSADKTTCLCPKREIFSNDDQKCRAIGDFCAGYDKGSDDNDRFLKAHNYFRARHWEDYSSAMLSTDGSLASGAQSYSDKCEWGHSSGAKHSEYGENIAASNASDYTLEYSVEQWYSEIVKYTPTTGYSEVTGHYTALIWKDVSKLGCGFTQQPGCAGYGNYSVCRYSDGLPNYNNQFGDNVPKSNVPVRSEAETCALIYGGGEL